MRDKADSQTDSTASVNQPAPWLVTRVRVLPEYRLHVSFADGTAGEVDVSQLVCGTRSGVFAVLRDRRTFALASVVDGAVTWPGDLDLAPDTMYDEIRAHGTWTPRCRAGADARRRFLALRSTSTASER